MARAKNANDAEVTGRGPSSRAHARDLRRFLPSVEMTTLFLCELSGLGGINFLDSFCETITWLVSKEGRFYGY